MSSAGRMKELSEIHQEEVREEELN